MPELIWPFRTKDPAQFRRVDKGWDLQGAGPGEEDVLAVSGGVVTYAHDPGTDGGHFGDPYPLLNHSVYYGHVHPVVPEGTRVHQGEVIARTSTPGGGGAPGHWLEIGWWNNGPVGNGQAMKDALINAPVFQGDDMPLNADDLSKITTIVQQQIVNACVPGGRIFGLYADFYNNQYAPLFAAIKAEVDAIKAKVGA